MIKKVLCNNYFYYPFVGILFAVVFYFGYTLTAGCSMVPTESHDAIGGTPPFYEGHDNEIAPNPNK